MTFGDASDGETMMHTLSIALLAMIVSVGCDQLTQQTQQKTPAPASAPKSKANRVAVHRFVQTKFDGGVAFDSQTGQICRTWDWSPIAKPAKSDADTGLVPQRAFGEYAPTCLSLYEKYPSGTDSGAEVISDESTSN
jgi:hypothetical protein